MKSSCMEDLIEPPGDPVSIQLSVATIVTTTKQHGNTYTKQDSLHPKIKPSRLYPILFIDHYDGRDQNRSNRGQEYLH